MRLGDMIPNPVSKFKSDNIWTRFWPKKSKTDVISGCAKFRQFVGQKGVKCCPIRILRPDLESSHQRPFFKPQNEKGLKIYVLAPIKISKLGCYCARRRGSRLLKKDTMWTRKASENHINLHPDPIRSWNLAHTKIHSLPFRSHVV